MPNVIQVNRRHKYRIMCLFIILCIIVLIILYKDFGSGKISGTGKEIFEKRGLTFKKRNFYLDGEAFQILSGAVHYFRVVPEYWEDRLLKLKAAGLNTVETYSPWNMHEEIRGNFNFEGILNIRNFIKKAQQLGLFVIVRPGPYICSELDFGGLPSWLLHDPNMKVRSMYFAFTKAVDEYFRQLLHEIIDLQYLKGGPIIAFQIENEYGTYGRNEMYMHFLKKTMEKYGVLEQMFVSENINGFHHTALMPGVLVTGNLNSLKDANQLGSQIMSVNRNFPVFISELWTGWFHEWGDKDKSTFIKTNDLLNLINTLLTRHYNLNLYMFHGGTNFGFTNGASSNQSLITSYDYDAPVSESGQITDKYMAIRRVILKHIPPEQVAKVPDPPHGLSAHEYGAVVMKQCLPFDILVDLIEKPITTDSPIMMEELPINSGGGQGYGFILYRSEFKNAQRVTFHGSVHDRGVVLVNSKPLNDADINAGVVNAYDTIKNKVLDLVHAKIKSKSDNILDILVENMGRVNYASFESPLLNNQRKGISGAVWLDEEVIKSWKIYPLEFRKPFMNKVSSSDKWLPLTTLEGPMLVRGHFVIEGTPQDTFIDLKGWIKGVVFINGVNIGRYWHIGPQRTLYIPGPLLLSGKNEIIIFELHKAGQEVKLIGKAIFEYKNSL